MSDTVSLFVPCLTDDYEPRVAEAVVRVLRHLGLEVDYPSTQTCCGQPLFNNGYTRDAKRLAKRMTKVFRGDSPVVTPSGSCCAMVKLHYPDLLPKDATGLSARTETFAAFVEGRVQDRVTTEPCRWEGKVALHIPCHARAIGAEAASARVMALVEGLEVHALDDGLPCCGFGGTFAVDFPAISSRMGETKAKAIGKSGVRWVICDEAGCGLQLRGACEAAQVNVGFKHLAEILAEGWGLLPRTPAAL